MSINSQEMASQGGLLDEQDLAELDILTNTTVSVAVDMMIKLFSDERLAPTVAAYTRSLYESLLSEGFTEEQALKIAMAVPANTTFKS